MNDSSPIADAGSLAVGTTSYPVPASAIFVATTGNDSSGNGSQSSPYQTLSKAVSVAAADDTIVVRAGVYNEGEDVQDQQYPFGVMITKNLTIQNYPNEAVWFDGSVPVTGSWTQNGSTWSTAYDRVMDRSPTFSHGQADGVGVETGAGGYFLTPENPQACWPDMVLLDGTQLTQVQSLSDVGPGKFFVDGHTGNDAYWFVGTKLYIGDNPAGHEIRYANKCKLATFAGTSNTSTLRGVGIRRYATFDCGFGALYLQHNMNLENVWFEDLSSQAVALDSTPSVNCTKLTARRIGFDFMGSNKARNIVLDRLDLQYCNYNGYYAFGTSIAAIKLAKTQFVTLKNSIFKHVDGNGFWVDQTCNTPIIVSCLFDDITNRSVNFETSSDGILANCRIINGATYPVLINDADTTRIYNNTISGNGDTLPGTGTPGQTRSGVVQIDIGQSQREYNNPTYSYCIDPSLPSSYYTDYPSHQWTINYYSVVNNVIANIGDKAYSMIYGSNDGDTWRSPPRTWHDMHPTIDGNVYHWDSNTPQYPWVLGQVSSTQTYLIAFNLASFQSQSGLDTHSTFATTNPLDSNYQLIDTSLHANATGLPSDIAALIGQPAGTKHIGCFW